MSNNNYSIGLDIGTNSVGWACVDEQFRVLKYRDRYAIGVHEFDAGETAVDRRIKRGARRRYNRRKRRIQLLQALWSPMMEHDTNFFQYVSETSRWKEDNKYFEQNSLSQVLHSLRQNPNKYPTIYHLRTALIENSQIINIKLIYLAIHNLVKHRGHFLNGTNEWTDGKRGGGDDIESFTSLLANYQQLTSDYHIIEHSNIVAAYDALIQKDLGKTEKHQAIMSYLPATVSDFIKLLLNLSTSYTKLFPLSDQIEEYKEMKGEAGKLYISAEDFEPRIDVLLDEERDLLLASLVFFQHLQLKELLGEFDYVSAAKVGLYNTYQQELKELKDILRKYGTEEEYRELFITSKENWRQYKKIPNINLLSVLDRYNVQAKPNQKMEDMIGNGAEKQDNRNTELYFNLFVRQLILSYQEDANTDKDKSKLALILKKIDERKFMVKQVTKSNAAIPVQNSIFEARRILEGQAKYYPYMTTEWIESVIQLIRFRIPYYVGPLVKGQTNHKFGWSVRHSNTECVTPFNFDKIIDQSSTAEGFITRMTNTCTYLKGEPVLPKHSLLYQQFEVLDELNRIQIRKESQEKHIDYRLDPKLKLWLIKEVFQKKIKVSHTDVLNGILRSPYKEMYADHDAGEQYRIYGTSKEKEFASTQSSFIKIRSILGDVIEEATDLYEAIIYCLTVFNEDSIIRYRLKQLHDNHQYGHLIHPDAISLLLGWKLVGWGKLSRKLLTGIPVYKQHSETLIEVMKQQYFVFNELLSPKHGYLFGGAKQKELSYLQDRIAFHNTEKTKQKKTTHRLTYADVQDLAGSPAIKRAIWKSIKLIEELVNIFGEPQHIIIEVAREEDKNKKNKRTKSREEQWQEYVKAFKGDEEFKAFIKRDEYTNITSPSYKNIKIWLYLLQMGKCLYSQTELRLNELHLYDIDHIVPQNLVKDDSLDNLALVKSEFNQRKSGEYVPLQIAVVKKNSYSIKEHWRKLHEMKLISPKKYHALMRSHISEIELNGFIERQLVETRQITKHVASMLEERFQRTSIHLVKAAIVSKFRQSNRLPKIREINNKHHAFDAFLAVVFIQSVISRYGKDFFQFSLHRQTLDKHLALEASNNKDFFLFRTFHDSRYPALLSDKGTQSAMEYLKEVMFELPWQSTYAIGSAESSFYNETIYSPKVKKNYDEVKEKLSQTELTHEGFKNIFSLIIEIDEVKKKQTSRKQLVIDVRLFDYYKLSKLSEQELTEHLVEKYYPEYKNAKYISKLQKYQRVIYNDEPAYFISSTELRNAKQICLDEKLYLDVAQVIDPKFMRKKGDASDQDTVNYKRVFNDLGEVITCNYGYLPGVEIGKFNKVAEKISTNEDAIKQVQEALKVSGANATRSDTLGGRWMFSSGLKANLMKIVYESITGLNYRK